MWKNEWRMMKVEGWMMQDDDFKLLRGFGYRQTDRLTDICECRVAFATENCFLISHWIYFSTTESPEESIHEYLSVKFLNDRDIPPALDTHVRPLVQDHHPTWHVSPQLHCGHVSAGLDHTLRIQTGHHGQLVTQDPVISPNPVTEPNLADVL